MGSEKQKCGGGGATSSGANTASVPQLWCFCKGGQGQKKKFAIFFAEPIFAKGTKPEISIFFAFFFFAQNNTLDRELIISANN